MTDILDRDFLIQKYTVEQLSDRQIAGLLDVPQHQVYLARRAFGISSRPRGHNLTGAQRPPIDYATMRGKRHTAESRARISAGVKRQVNRRSGQFHPQFGKTGEQNPNWKGGLSPERQRVYATYEWRVVVEYVYVRDEGQCQRCGCAIEHRHKQKHTHHIALWNEFPALRLDPDNIVLLCRPCHEWVHSAQNVERHFLLGVKES